MTPEDGCFECGYAPAKLWHSKFEYYICGVCWHRFLVAQDLAQRIRLEKLKEQMATLEEVERRRIARMKEVGLEPEAAA